jgi:hypothetical protein
MFQWTNQEMSYLYRKGVNLWKLYTILYFNLIFDTLFLSRPLYNICFRNAHGYFPLVVITFWFFPYSWFSRGFATRLTRQVPIVQQELPTLPDNMCSLEDFSGFRVTRSLVVCVCIVDGCLSFCPFPFGHCVICPSLIYEFRLLIWYLQTLLSLCMYCDYGFR